jgi:serine phosphatase RsbU (regulator of sigma subunit)
MSRIAKFYLWSIVALFALLILNRILDFSFINALKNLVLWIVFLLSVYYLFKFAHKLIQKFLWRIRRKLILSYFFIGVIPILLLFILFSSGFYIFMAQATSEMLNSAMDGYILQANLEAEKLLHFVEFIGPDVARDRWFQELSSEQKEWLSDADITLNTPKGVKILQGDGPGDLPGWVEDKNFSGLAIKDSQLWLIALRHNKAGDTLQIHAPVGLAMLEQIKKKIGANVSYVSGGSGVKGELEETVGLRRKDPIWPVWWDIPIAWLNLPDQYQWSTGEKVRLTDEEERIHFGTDETSQLEKEDKAVSVKTGNGSTSESGIGAFAITTNVSRVFNQVFSRSTELQKLIYGVIAGIAIFFLIIEFISFVSGFLLAKSITASVHNLFEGTERIKKGEFDYKIKVGAKDQLGDLAVSFNSMTESIQNLLKVRAEKERLAESLLIARQMQQNLLPPEITSAGGIQIAALNLPAQEVCGDYYDIIRKGDHGVGIIVADVSGKGPSAALYMAELKGVILSVSRSTTAPREIILEANQVLSPTLDSKSFITVTYAMIDESQRIMRMCRAGHNPLLYYSAEKAQIEIMQPRGIGLGLGRNGIFEKSLEEVERKLYSGDILVFYTDGLTEAMNEQRQLYGLPRLSDIILKNKDLGTEQIKAAILRDLEQFLNKTLPQDDITLVLLKIP